MVFDIRAKVTSTLQGELISATISDSFIPGAGLIKTTGTALMSLSAGASINTAGLSEAQSFTIRRADNDVYIIPRRLYVIGYARDTLRNTVQYELGCKLTIKERVKQKDSYKLNATQLQLDKCFDIVTNQIEAEKVRKYALSKAGLTVIASTELANKFSVKEFDLSGGYISAAADLAFSEGYCIHQKHDSEGIAMTELDGSSLASGICKPIDITPTLSGEVPGSKVVATFNTLKLLDADPLNDPKDIDWEEEETIGSVTHISVRYKDGDDVWESSFAYIPYQKTITTYDEWERVVRRVTTTETIGAALSPNYVQALIENDFKQGSSIVGAASLAFGNSVLTTTTTTRITYVIPCPEVEAGACNFGDTPPPEGYEEVESEVTTVEEPLIALAGSVPGSFFDEDDNLDTIGPQTVVTSITTVTYEQEYRNVRVSVGTDEDGDVEIKRIGSFPVTKTKTHFKKAYAYTSYGQMELAMRARQGRSIGEMLGAAKRLCDGDVEMRIVTGREAAVQIRPSLADRIFNSYRDKSDSDNNDNGFGTERRTEVVETELKTDTAADGMIEISIPYSSDDKFNRTGTPPNIFYTAEPPTVNPGAIAKKVALVQAKLIYGAKSGISVQALPEDIPKEHIATVTIDGGKYLVNGRTYTLDANGAVVSFDGIPMGTFSGVPGGNFPAAPSSVASLPPPVRSTGTLATLSGNPQTVLDAAFPNATAQDAVRLIDTGDYWVYDGTDWVFKGQNPGAIIVNNAPNQYIGTIATVGSNPQTALNTAFPARVTGDGVRAVDTNYVWVYDGTVWQNRDQNPGEVVELPPGSTVGLFNVEVRTTSTVRSKVAVTKFDYALGLLSLVPSTTVRSKALVKQIVKVLPPAGAVTLGAAAPVVSGGASAQVPTASVSLAAVAPAVSGGGSALVPGAAIALLALPPEQIGRPRTEVAVPFADVTLTATAPTIAVSKLISVPAADISVVGHVPTIMERLVPSFVTNSGNSFYYGAFSANISWPTGYQINDVALAIVETDGVHSIITPPSGWASVTGSPVTDVATNAGNRLYVWWRRATSLSMPGFSIGGQSGDDYHMVSMAIFRNCVTTGDPWDVVATGTKTSASTTATIPAVTTTKLNTRVVMIAGRPDDSSSTTHFGTPVNANLTGLTKHFEAGTEYFNGGGFVVASGVMATAGNTGTSTMTKAVSTTDTYYAVALRSY